MTQSVVVYVALPDEVVPVWRPVFAEHLGANRYRLVADQRYDSEHERWEFVPGDEVICEQIGVAEGTILAAKRKA